MDILPQNQDAVALHRELQRQLRAGELGPSEYQAAFRTIDAAYSVRPLCENGDGRLATAVLNGENLCSACWVAARGAW
jgi:hypothetical protein